MSDGRAVRRDEKRERVLDAAEALLREGGPEALNMRALAERADVGHVTPYRLFESKHEIVLATLLRATARHWQPMRPGDADADPLDDLLARQRRLLDLLAADEVFARAALRALDDSAPAADRGRWLEWVASRSGEELERLSAVGLLRADAPLELTRRLLLIGRDGAVRRWFRGQSSLEELRTDYVALTVQALLAVSTDAGRQRLWRELAALDP